MKGINVPVMLLSLGLSVILWVAVFVQNSKEMLPVRYAVKLNQEGLPENLVVTKMDELFRFTAAGPERVLRDMRSDNLSAYVDLANATSGTRHYPVKIIPDEIENFVTTKPLSTRVTIEPLESKTLNVEVEGQGQLKDRKLRLSETVVEPSEVTVRGPKSLVDRARKGRVRLDLSTIDTSVSKAYTMSVDVLDADGKPLEQGLIRTEPIFVRVTPVLTVAPEEKTVFVVPRFTGEIAAGHVAEGAFVDPKQVTILGPSLAVAAISKVQTLPIDISGLRETTTFTVRLQIPTGLSVRKGEETVEVRVPVRAATVPAAPSSPREPVSGE